jgi:cellulose synthase/poly-beta-1,6-N-acetylglucosamine synthase-like glycosyltransferase
MSISVIIPALNEETRIEECLRSIRAQDVPCELIVIDNGSTDRTTEIARKYCDKVLIEPEMNLSQMRTLGVEHSTGDIIVTTDADCIAPPQWLNELLKPFQDSKVKAVGGPFKPTNPSTLAGLFCFFSSKTQLFGLFGGGNMAYRRSAYNKSRGYDNATRAEDWRLSWNLKATGKTVHVPKAYTKTEIPLNRQLEYPFLLVSLFLLFIGIRLQWYIVTGFALGYLSSLGITFLYKYRKSLTLTMVAIFYIIGFILFREYLDEVNNMYFLGGTLGVLVYLFGVEYLRMGLEFWERVKTRRKKNRDIADLLIDELSQKF